MKRIVLPALLVSLMAGVGSAALPIDAEAAKLLDKLAGSLKSQEAIAFTATVTIERTAGQFTQRDERSFRFTIQRPDKLRMEPLADSVKRGGTVVANGEQVIAYAPPAGKYSQGKQEGSLDELIAGQTMAVLSGGISQTVGPLLMSDPMAALTSEVQKIESVEGGHIRIHRRGGAIDWWFDATGAAPLPVKAEPDLSAIVDRAKAAGQDLKLSMQMKISDFTTEPEIGDDTFAFDPPEGVKKVASLFEGPKMARGNAQGLVGKPAPAFELESLKGDNVSLADLKGKIVILDFFATWCGPCRAALPKLEEIASEYEGKQVVLVIIDLKEPKQKVAAMVKPKTANVRVLLDSDGAVAGQYAVRGIPQTVIVDRDGKIKSVHVGLKPKEVITKDLDEIIDGDEVAG